MSTLHKQLASDDLTHSKTKNQEKLITDENLNTKKPK